MSSASSCPVCQTTQTELLFQEFWPIVSLPTVEIGFVLCTACGFVFQQPAVPADTMNLWYERLNNYINPSRSGLPPPGKVQMVTEQLAYLQKHGPASGVAWQVGSSDGYTLSRLREVGWRVLGIEPSVAANRLAQTLYGVDCQASFFENFSPPNGSRCDLLVLTHVLEHFTAPGNVLARARDLLTDDGVLFIEVPSLQSPEQWCAGYFSLEHASYFWIHTLSRLLQDRGFEPAAPPEFSHDYQGNPAVRLLARKRPPSSPPPPAPENDYERARAVCLEYLSKEHQLWNRHNETIKDAAGRASRVLIWGAGIHTSQLFARCPALARLPVTGIVDNDPQKHHATLNNHEVRPLTSIDWDDPDLAVIISTFSGEKEILRGLSERGSVKATVIPLYNNGAISN